MRQIFFILITMASLSFLAFFIFAKTSNMTINVNKNDVADVIMLRQKFSDLHLSIKDSERVFSDDRSFITNKLAKEKVLHLWKTFLDYILVADFLYKKYDHQDELNPSEINAEPFTLKYALFLMQYRYAMQIIFELEKHKDLHTVLNEPVPELGLQKGSYSKLKYRFLNILIATEFSRLSLLNKQYSNHALSEKIEEDEAFVWNVAKGKGPYETVKNGVVLAKDGFSALLFPIKKNVLSVGKYKVRRFDGYLISEKEKEEISKQLEPGDILVSRREWHISNLGIPGFWTHAALYIGTPEQRALYFNTKDVQNWVKKQGEESGEFEMLLKHKFTQYYEKITSATQKNNVTIESYSPGVSLTDLDFSADADSLGAIRPNTDKQLKAEAIYNAFSYLGRPYDYEFDFLTDSALVCSELVVKAYSNRRNRPEFLHSTVMGKQIVSPNDFIEQLDQEYNLETRNFSPVFFYDGSEKHGVSKKTSHKIFRESWKRPKWHILFH